MAWAHEIEDGLKDLESDGAGVTITKWNRRAVSIKAIQGSGLSYDTAIDGGLEGSENPAFTIRRAAVEAEAPGKTFKQGDTLVVAGKTLKVKAVTFDPADPSVRITTEGEDQ